MSASALTQTEGTGTFGSLSKMALAEAVQRKGWDASLWTAMEPAMASCSSATEAKAPRGILRLVMAEKKPSTALSHEAEVGVKWSLQRG